MINSITSLHKKYLKKDIYIVGTGPSMRLFPANYFKDKITIGLNQAFQYFAPTYCLTIHPYLIPTKRTAWNTKWITKIKSSDPSWEEHDNNGNIPYFLIFNNNNDPRDFSFLNEGGNSKKLYVGCGIQTGAIHLAAKMGASNVILVGCDATSIASDLHGKDQHIETHGYELHEVFREYLYYTTKVKEMVKELYKMNVFSLTPFVGLRDIDQQYQRALKVNGLELLPDPKLVENNIRQTPIQKWFFD